MVQYLWRQITAIFMTELLRCKHKFRGVAALFSVIQKMPMHNNYRVSDRSSCMGCVYKDDNTSTIDNIPTRMGIFIQQNIT